LHRRKFAVIELDEFDNKLHISLSPLTILLRLAVVLHCSRIDVPVPTIDARDEGCEVSLKFPNGWLGEHPLTRADLAQEAEFLAGAGITLRYA
jgi:exopolyphosphatase / guanosine-5'-triphosphate,3'-diphosphate pyrophosphatase